jgi:hypothetical protein
MSSWKWAYREHPLSYSTHVGQRLTRNAKWDHKTQPILYLHWADYSCHGWLNICQNCSWASAMQHFSCMHAQFSVMISCIAWVNVHVALCTCHIGTSKYTYYEENILYKFGGWTLNYYHDKLLHLLYPCNAVPVDPLMALTSFTPVHQEVKPIISYCHSQYSEC